MLYLIVSFLSPVSMVITLFIQRSSFTVPLSRNKHPLRTPIRNLVPCTSQEHRPHQEPEHPTRQVLDHLRRPLGNCQEPSPTQEEPILSHSHLGGTQFNSAGTQTHSGRPTQEPKSRSEPFIA